MGKEDLYVVEKILDRKTVAKKTLYLVQWEGYGPESNTWEPLINVRKTIALADYEAMHPLEKRTSLSIRSDSVKRSRSTGSDLDASNVDQLGDSQITAGGAENDREDESKENTSPLMPPVRRLKPPAASPAQPSPSDADAPLTSKRVRRLDGSPRAPKTAKEAKRSNVATIPSFEGALPPSPTLTMASADVQLKEESIIPTESIIPATPTEEPINPLIDISKVANVQPNKRLVPECVLAIFPRKKSTGMYCLMEWKNAEDCVQFLDVEYVREHYPQMLIDYFIAERANKAH